MAPPSDNELLQLHIQNFANYKYLFEIEFIRKTLYLYILDLIYLLDFSIIFFSMKRTSFSINKNISVQFVIPNLTRAIGSQFHEKNWE